jgi:hypothetical protein
MAWQAKNCTGILLPLAKEIPRKQELLQCSGCLRNKEWLTDERFLLGLN